MGKWAEGDFWRNFSIGIDIFERTWYYLFSDDECEVCVSKMKTKEEESGKVWPIQFCSHCGARLRDGVKFCENCREAVPVKAAEPIDKDTGTERKTERSYIYEGVVHKCPNCGEVLGSFELNCPACGYEINSTELNPPTATSTIDAINRQVSELECGRFRYPVSMRFMSLAAVERVETEG